MASAPTGFKIAYCPSCERYIGATRACPYCDCDAYTPPSLLVLRSGALLLAGLGLLLLYGYAYRHPIPRADIDRLIPMMNYATVRLTGTVSTQPYTGRSRGGDTDYLAFSLDGDGGQSVRVQAYGTVAAELDHATVRPTPGMRAHVTGQLQVAPDGAARLRLRQPADFAPADAMENMP